MVIPPSMCAVSLSSGFPQAGAEYGATSCRPRSIRDPKEPFNRPIRTQGCGRLRAKIKVNALHVGRISKARVYKLASIGTLLRNFGTAGRRSVRGLPRTGKVSRLKNKKRRANRSKVLQEQKGSCSYKYRHDRAIDDQRGCSN